MSLDAGNEYAKLNGYSIYQFSNPQLGTYYVSIPIDYIGTYELFVGFSKKDLHDLPKQEVIEQIEDINKMLHSLNAGMIYAIPDISTEELSEAAKENDDRKYKQLLVKVQSMTAEIYQTLTTTGIAKESINNVISIVKQTESDTKFIQWLEINLPNFIEGVTYEEIRQHYYEKISKEHTYDNTREDVLEKKPEDTQEIVVEEYAPKANGIEPIDHTYDYDPVKAKKNIKVKRLVKKNNNMQSAAFSKISFMILVIVLALIFGISIAYLLIK